MKKNKIKITSFEAHIGMWMRIISNQVSCAFARKLWKNNITVAEWVILRSMYDNHTTSSSIIADQTGLTRGAVSKLITRLLDKDLVTRQESDIDRRYQNIELTQKGFDVIPHLSKLADQNEEDFFSKLTQQERVTLHKILIKIAVQNKLSKLPIK